MNPILPFFNSFQADIIANRETLFSELKSVNIDSEKFTRSILDLKERQEQLPSLGEIFPWILCDLFNLDKTKLQRSNVGWLGLYVYVIYIDKLLDDNYSPKPEEILGSSILQGYALRNLMSVVINTPYENDFYKYLYSSAFSGLSEVQHRLEFDNLPKKESIAIGKNRLLLAYASCVAATCTNNSNEILKITKSLLITLQLLDDLADFENDLTSQNYSYLLSIMLKNNNNTVFDSMVRNICLTRQQIIQELISSNALLTVLNKIITSLHVTTSLISKIKIVGNESKASYLITDLLINVCNFREYVVQIDKEQINEVILDNVESHIKIIAQSS